MLQPRLAQATPKPLRKAAYNYLRHLHYGSYTTDKDDTLSTCDTVHTPSAKRHCNCLQMKNDPRSYDRNFYNCVKKPEKNSGLQRGLNPWPRDTGATLYQLSYEATDVGSRSILGSYVPVKDM